MKLLLDTCVFLVLVGESKRLPLEKRRIIAAAENQVFLSSVSAAEIAIKHSLGKLQLPTPPNLFVPRTRTLHQIDPLPLDEASTLRLGELPLIHRDPFDRLLICQALAHNLTLVTFDAKIHRYGLPLL